MASSLTLPNVQISYPHLFQRQKMSDGQLGKYSASFTVKCSEKATMEKIESAIAHAISSSNSKSASRKFCIIQESSADGLSIVIRTATNKTPLVVDRRNNKLSESDNPIQTGAYVNASIMFYVQIVEGEPRLVCGLHGVQFLRAGVLLKNMFTLNSVQLSFPHLFEPSAYKPGAPATYQASLLIRPDDSESLRIIAKNILELKESAGGKAVNIPDDKVCFKMNTAVKLGAAYVKKHHILKLYSKKQPIIVDSLGNLITEDNGDIRAGCYVNAKINLWFQDSRHGRRINGCLLAVQYVRSGELRDAPSESAILSDFDKIGTIDDSDEVDKSLIDFSR
jgi:hypothetical protein